MKKDIRKEILKDIKRYRYQNKIIERRILKETSKIDLEREISKPKNLKRNIKR